ncbi:hypothetical protein BGW36DRAFT_378410 [Talaromyces proteolyticus]|uniref:NAD-dependent epimerase/dehydratase domain-containing protein n=1 Tax=Talaromyces proteolyticus TaxID=1131652 RepID=A0AAD4Q0J1_9EURO|nr:uncharacterized protein BGW36DRAFT_378410 [Talaromyces proteolyticus]KAH8697306.1 hypothetical protein BGW36DRAFT_378410 [Talaromyces proteolyticus]
MPRILILGATGYVGSRVANLLVRNGNHVVYGLARSTEKGSQLAQKEIIPVICPDPINNPSSFLSVVRSAPIDVVVDLSGANQDSAKILESLKQIGKERCEQATQKGAGAVIQKLGFVYCSGTWVHGSSSRLVSDIDHVGHDAVTLPPALVAWRAEFEKEILSSRDVLDVLIVRPALIYGYESTIWTSLIQPLLHASQSEHTAAASIKVPLDPESKPGLIHVDDVASGFEKAIDKFELLSGTAVYPVFDLATSQESMEEIIKGFAVAWQFKGSVELVGYGDNPFFEAMSTTMRNSSQRARQLLDWTPTRLNGMIMDIDMYAAAFAASVEKAT